MKDHRDDRDLERIRRLLANTAPAAPDPSGRAATVEARARQQRKRGTIGAVAVVGAVAAVVITPTFLKTNVYAPDNVAGPADATQASGPTPGATGPPTASSTGWGPTQVGSCPGEDDQAHFAATGRAPHLSSDAAFIRLCAPTYAGAAVDWVAPQDALIVDVDTFVSALRERQAADPDRCQALRPQSDPYFFRVGFVLPRADQIPPDVPEQTFFVSSMCTDIVVEGKPIESDVVLDSFFDALAEQRRQSPAPERTVLECSSYQTGYETRGVPVTTSTAFGSLCFGYGRGARVVDATDVMAQFNEEWRQALDLRDQPPLRVNRCPLSDVDMPRLTLVTQWGDVVALEMNECGDYRIGHYQFLPSQSLHDLTGLPYEPDLPWSAPPES